MERFHQFPCKRKTYPYLFGYGSVWNRSRVNGAVVFNIEEQIGIHRLLLLYRFRPVPFADLSPSSVNSISSFNSADVPLLEGKLSNCYGFILN